MSEYVIYKTTGLSPDRAANMTLRDWYAGKALATAYAQHETDPNKTAEWAFQVADAMLAARKGGAA